MHVLIIGASGFIGSNIKKYFEKKGEKVVGTSFPEKIEGYKYFSVADSSLSELNINLNEIDYAVICSGISNINECKKNKVPAYKINVLGNKKLIEQCFENNIIPVFLSSDAVFDGKKGNYTELDETSPCNEYGKHKKAVEDFLLKSGQDFFIARLSKVFGDSPNDGTFITSLISQLKQNKILNCAADQIFCPMFIDDLAGVLYLALKKKLRGLYNIASPESFSRFELAILLKSKLKIKQGQIIKCSIKDINSYDELPANISMDSSKIRKETGFKFTRMSAHIKKFDQF